METKLIYLSLGSNLGDRLDFLQRGLESVSQKIGTIERCSAVYQTDPWGFVDSNPFLNRVAGVRTLLEPGQVLDLILEIEQSMGRDRGDAVIQGAGRRQFRSRTIDIDILFFDDVVIDSPGLVIPHPLIPVRRFVLVPMEAISPGLVHPVLHKTIRQLLDECPDHSGVALFTGK